MSIYYLAYGSNLHPVRLLQRIQNPLFISTFELSEYQLKFNKAGQDGSAKCTIEYTGHQSDHVMRIVYKIQNSCLRILDQIEGVNKGFAHMSISVSIENNPTKLLTYIAMPDYIDPNIQPYQWYKQFVLLGMMY